MKVKNALEQLKKANPEAEISIDDWDGDLRISGDFTLHDTGDNEVVIIPQGGLL